jgi:Bacterial protein of unknown function (DUF937)
MATMLEGFHQIASPAILTIVARRNGEPESAVLKGFTTAMTAMAATIASRSRDRGFLKDLMVVAGETAKAPDALTAIGCVVAVAPSVDTATASGRWLSRLFGHELPSVIDRVAFYAGIRRSSAVSILSAVAPLVLTYFGRLMRKEHVTISDLAMRLRKERAHAVASLPRDFDLLHLTAISGETQPRHRA